MDARSSRYHEVYARWQRDPEGFWAEAAADIDRDKLEGSGARIVIVNLDADSDTYIDHLYDVLDEGDYEVLFNDAQVSSNLSGWDHARWARNLAAKLLRQPAIATPPRPYSYIAPRCVHPQGSLPSHAFL